MTYTCATMEVSRSAYDEIKKKLENAGYDHAIDSDGGLDMTHIMLTRQPEPTPKRARQLVSSDEAVDGKIQHTEPCSDCPFSRKSLNGWLGGTPVDGWVRIAHSDAFVDCHTIRNTQCAGIAIYRANVVKQIFEPNLQLPRDTDKVFSTPAEFKQHHSQMPCNQLQNGK